LVEEKHGFDNLFNKVSFPQNKESFSFSEAGDKKIFLSQYNVSESGVNDGLQDPNLKAVVSGEGSIPAWQLPLAGLFGALLAWGVTEISYAGYTPYYFNIADMTIYTDLFIITVSGLIGATLGSVSGIYEKKAAKAIIGILIGLLVGIIVGMTGGFVANTILSLDQSGQTTSIVVSILAYALAWCLTGFFLGFGQGLGALKKIGMSAIGGMLGGLLGGILFDVFAIFISAPEALIRGIAICFLGLCIGLGVSFAQLRIIPGK
jgi:hypothetical protein